MEQLFALLAIFIVTTFIDIVAQITWFPPYFRFGIPVFFSKRTLTEIHNLSTIQFVLETSMQGEKWWQPSIATKIISTNEIAYRENYFLFKFRFRWIPIMHSRIHFRAEDGQLTILSFLNLQALVLLWVFFPRFNLDSGEFSEALCGFLLVFGFSYWWQMATNLDVLSALTRFEDKLK